MKCVWTQKVSLLIDDELPSAEAHELTRHLDACGDCQSAREDFLLLRRRLADYPHAHDAFARQRALRRILAAGGDRSGRENETAAPPSRRAGFAGAFAMPRLSAAGLAALLLLLFGVAAGVVSLMNARRAPVEVVANAPMPAPATNNNNNGDSSNRTPPAPTPVPHDLTASANRQVGVVIDGSGEKRMGEETSKGTHGDAGRSAGGRAPGSTRSTSNTRRVESASVRIPKSTSTPPSYRSIDRQTDDAPEALAASNTVEAPGGANNTGINDAGVDVAGRRDAGMRESAGASKTARHVEQAQLLLRSFRNARVAGSAGRRGSSDLAYDRQRSKKLLYENIVLRREAASRGNLPVESLLDSLEPILIDIANLPDRPAPADLREINERMRRQNLVAMLHISAVESASARSY